MGKNTTEAEVIVTLNGATARNELKRLEDEIRKYEEAAAAAYKAGDKATGDKMAKNAQNLRKEFNVAKKELKDFSDMMKSLNTKTINELRSASKQLEKQIRNLSPATKEYAEKSKQLQQVNTRIKDLTASFKAVTVETSKAKFTLKDLVATYNHYWGAITMTITAMTSMSLKFRQCAEEAAKLDDIYSDVMKTTGLLHEEVEALDKELMKIDTRTSREQLLLLARDAGKLGISGQQDILGFVRAADKIQVALGEDLGEGAIRNLGKIADVLGYTKSMGIEKALLSIASAVNAVGQASTASEGYLVEFTQRMAGVGQLANLSAANIIGFASGLDQSAMKVEMASTAFQKFMMKLYSEPEKFAKYAKQSVSEFADLMKNDANAAMIAVLQGLRDIGDMSELTSHFDEMGLDGARTVQVLGAMASNLNAVTEAQALANVEFSKATSVGEEYATKNNNLQAQLEKARKEFHNASIALGQSLNPIMLKSTKATTYLIRALASYGKEIKTVLIVIAALTVALKAKAIWMKVVATWNATLRTGSLALAAAQALLTGNVTRAAAAWKLMNTAMKASVLGVTVGLVSALWIAIDRLVKKQKEAKAEAQYMEDINKRINQEYSEQAGKITALNNIVHNNNLALEQRQRALEKLKQIVPDYHADLTEEGKLIGDNTDALKAYLDNLEKVTRSKILEDEFTKATAEVLDFEKALEDANAAADKALQDANGNAALTYQKTATMMFDGQQWEQTLTYTTEYGEKMQVVTAATTDLNKALEKQAAIKARIEKNEYVADGEETPNGNGNGGGGGGGDDKKAKKAFDKRNKELQKQFKTQERELKISLLKREISEAEYDARVYAAHMENLRLRLEAARQYGQDDTDIQNEFLDMQIKAIEKQSKEQQKILDAFEKHRRDLAKKKEEEDAKQLVDKAKSMAKEQEILEKNLQEIRDRLGRENWKEEYDFEMWKLRQLHNQGLVSERDYQEAKLKIKLDYAKKAAEQVNSIAEQASNFVTALKEAESAQLEAEYQKQLTAAGDNAEERERIEAEYEQKKLDLQKKYADTEMIINIAKAIAAGALAAIEAFAAAGNPILGAVFAAIIAATTAAEVATIIAQRNAIKNTSVGGSSSPSVKTGQRTMTGYAEGGYTENHTTLTTVGEKGVEYVIPNWMVRKNPVMVANLERYRKSGSHGKSGSISRGFADGGFTAPTDDVVTTQSNMAIEAAVYNAIRAALDGEWIRAYLVRKDLSEIDAQDKRFKKQTAR